MSSADATGAGSGPRRDGGEVTDRDVAEPAVDLDDPLLAERTVTNDAVGGETVLEGDSYGGPTGSEPREAEPILDENDLADEPIDLSDEQG